ncbi:monoacylglycerol lipase ABHD6-like [Clytia hemisphaerica]|eukprot:TCONS_00049023-protein
MEQENSIGVDLLKLICLLSVAGFTYFCYRMQKDPKLLLQFLNRLARLFLGFQEKYVTLPGYKNPLCYMEKGYPSPTTPTFVFVPGFSCNKEFFGLVSSHLPTKSHVISLDNPGHGKSVLDEDKEISIEFFVDTLKKFVDTIGLKQIHLVGESMGGHIVGYYAAKYPADLSTVCMLCPHGLDFPWFNDLKNKYLKEGRHFLMPHTFEEMKFTSKQLTVKDLPFPNIVLKGMLQDRLEREKFYDELLKMLCSPPNDLLLQNNLQKIQVPAVVIFGKEDKVLGYESVFPIREKVKSLKKCVVLENTGHLLTLECPKIVAKNLIELSSSI